MIDILLNDIKNRAIDVYEGIYTLLDEAGHKVDKRKLIFEIRDDEEINGRAWCANNEDHIEINKGVIRIYAEYFLEVNNYFVNKELEKITSAEDEELLKSMTYEAILFDDGKVNIIDSKEVVKDRTKLLEIFVSRFILLHECGHVFNGHCNYLSDFYKENYFIQMRYRDDDVTCDGKRNRALDNRTLEMDADMFATTQSIYHLLFLYSCFDEQVKCTGMKPMELFYWWAFAIRSHFLICEDRFMDTHKYSDEMFHLPSNARWGMIADTVVSLIHNNINSKVMDIKAIEIMFFYGAMSAEKIFNELKYSKYSWMDELKDNEKYFYYKAEVNTHWKELINSLRIYSRCPLAE